MKSFLNKCAIAVAFAGLFTTSAMAAPVSLGMVWSGASFGNNASAYGTVVLDDSVLLSNTNDNVSINSLTSLDIYTSGGGHFNKDDYTMAYMFGLNWLDWSKELIGQMLPNNCAFGTSRGGDCGDGWGGDFNFVAEQATTPNGSWNFELQNEAGQKMLLTSLKVSDIDEVPEPASLALFGLALAGAAVARRKKA